MENGLQQRAAHLSRQFHGLAQDFRDIDPAGGYQRVQELAGWGAKLCKQAHDAGLLDIRSYKRSVALLALCEAMEADPFDVYSEILARTQARVQYDQALEKIVAEAGEIPKSLPGELDETWARACAECNELLEQLPVEDTWPRVDLADRWSGTWMGIVRHLAIDHPEELPCNPFVNNRYLASFGGQAPRSAKTEWRSLAQNYAMVADWLANHLQAGNLEHDAASTGQGVTIFDLAFLIEEDEKAAAALVKRMSNSKKMTARPIGRCPLDGRRSLYQLPELLSDARNILSLSPAEICKYRQALASKQRDPKEN